MTNTAERVKNILVEHLGVESERIIGIANLIINLGADSLDILELVMAFEEEFSIEIYDDETEKFVTVADCVRIIDEKLAA